MCSMLCWIFLYLRRSRLHFLHFWLDSCIVNKGDKLELVLGYWMHLESFQVVSSHFWALVCTGLTGWSHRSDRSECWPCSHVSHWSDRWCRPVWPVRAELMQLLYFSSSGLHAFVQGKLHWFRGACMCAGEDLCVFSSFGLVVCALCLSIVLSRMCWAIALA
jgi:hypothetical protein